MSVEQVLARIAQIETALSAPSATAAASLATPATSLPSANATTAPSTATASPTSTAGTATGSASSFADTLDQALAPEADATASILGNDDSDGDSSDPSDPLAADSPLSLQSLLAADPALAGERSLLSASASPLGASATASVPSSLQSVLASDPTLLAADPALASAGATAAPSGAAPSGAGNPAIVAIARSQVGVTEEPPGSNNSPVIAEYRTATAGAMPGEPWCAYFASWVARQAGEPLGAQGQGFGAVADIWSWAQQTGRAVTNGPGVVPQPGDLIVFGDHHVGIVDQVLPDGDIETVEGNYDNSVSLVVRGPDEATGYVRMS